MLYSVPDLKRQAKVPHADAYHAKKQALDALDPTAFDRVHATLTEHFDACEIDTSSFIPGKDWTGTVYDPLFRACGYDDVSAALFFGQIVWQAVMDHPACWAFGRYDIGGVPLRGITYFRIDCP